MKVSSCSLLFVSGLSVSSAFLPTTSNAATSHSRLFSTAQEVELIPPPSLEDMVGKTQAFYDENVQKTYGYVLIMFKTKQFFLQFPKEPTEAFLSQSTAL